MPRNQITVGLDDSPSGRAALRWAAQYALTSGSPLRAIQASAHRLMEPAPPCFSARG
jgi:hypothetical protein